MKTDQHNWEELNQMYGIPTNKSQIIYIPKTDPQVKIWQSSVPKTIHSRLRLDFLPWIILPVKMVMNLIAAIVMEYCIILEVNYRKWTFS